MESNLIQKNISDDLALLEDMMMDLNKNYQVDTFWSNYQFDNHFRLKHFGLKDFRKLPNSYGGLSTVKSNFPGSKLALRIFYKIIRDLKLDWLPISIKRFLYIVFYAPRDDPSLIYTCYGGVILELINTLPHGDKLLEVQDSLSGKPTQTLELRGKKYSLQFIRYFFRLLVINRFMKLESESTSYYLEIGGGYGGYCEVLRKTYPNVKIVFIDIAPQLYVAEQYLKSVFPGKVAGYNETKQLSIINSSAFAEKDILILPPWDIGKIEDNFINNFSNQSSFQEMSKETVNDYCDHLGRIIRNNVVLYEMREGNGSVEDPVLREDYIRFLEKNGFKLVEEQISAFGGHLRSDPSAPLSHQDFYFFSKK